MTLTELDTLPSAVLPVRDLADHLRLGTGFADDGAEDPVLETYLRAALSAIEARCAKALIARRFSWSVTAWRDGQGQTLPIAPVSTIESVTLVAGDGAQTPVDPAKYGLAPDGQAPRLVAKGSLPTVPNGGRCDIVFTAGYGADWDAVPGGLQQAVRLLAASYFEHRSGAGRAGDLPFAVDALIEPYRALRIGGGAV